MVDQLQTKGERTRQAILDAAYGLIIEQGYAATSMRQIAERAGLAPGSLYNHFASKGEIFSAILLERHPFLQIMPILNSIEGESVEEYVHTAAQTLVDQLGHHPDVLNLMLTEIVEFRGEHVPLMFGNFAPRVIPLIQKIGHLDGEMRQIPPFVLVRAFVGMFFSYYITGALLGQAMPAVMQANALDHFVDIFLHGILVKETA
jgi:AcrR family transcriptional regulator